MYVPMSCITVAYKVTGVFISRDVGMTVFIEYSYVFFVLLLPLYYRVKPVRK